MPTPKKRYACSQEVLIIICILAYGRCRELLAKFSRFKSKYTDSYLDDALKKVNDAKKIEVVSKRNATKKESRTDLVAAAKLCRQNFNKLKRFISDAFPKAVINDKFQAAGASFYKKAAKNNWSAQSSLINAAITFIEDNLVELNANGNMPADFETTFKEDGKACTDLITKYFGIDTTNRDITFDKIEADNAIFDALTDMLKDAQECLPEKDKRNFVFSYLRKLAKGQTPGSLKGYIRDQNKKAIAGAVITILGTELTTITSTKGYYRFGRLAAGEYIICISIPGRDLIEQTVTIKGGTAKTLSITIPALEAAA